MLALLGLVTLGVSSAAAYLVRARQRAARWNARHLCGWCASPLPLEHAFVDGHAVCANCVGAARWRLGATAGLALGTSVVMGAALLVPAVRWMAAGIPVAAPYLLAAGAATAAPLVVGILTLRRMQARNRAALAASPTTTRLPATAAPGDNALVVRR